MPDLDGRVAVVTGAARGIGLGTAERLNAAGAAVVVADIDGATAEKGAKTLNGRAIAVEHDVRDGESSRRLRQKALDAFGRVDILVNNAGVGPKPGPVQDTTDAEYDRVMNVNARGLFLTTRAFVQGMIDQKSGRIINISSIVGQTGFAMVLPYVASKFAVTGMTHSLASELAPHNITVNSIHPGILATDLPGINRRRRPDRARCNSLPVATASLKAHQRRCQGSRGATISVPAALVERIVTRPE